jgi:uncharacterized protein involved in exopolysaccharide biosynthesis
MMPEPFDAYQFLHYLRRRWRLFAAAGVVAVALAAALTLLQTKQYTAVTRIVIDPPAAADPRAATAVSPIYVESLRTYEHFASSDSLFQRALDKFQLRRQAPGRTIESWKKRVLRVEIPRSTKILEIRATLEDARTAHLLARFLAQETVRLNQAVNLEGDRELARAVESELEQAHAERDKARETYLALMRNEPVEALEAALQSLKSRRFAVERDLLEAETLVAESAAPGAGPSSDAGTARARADHLRGERERLNQEITRTGAVLSSRTARLEQARTRLDSADRAAAALEAKLREARGIAGQRGERLRLIDPGVVPERPSSPNLPLNLAVALLAAMAGALLYASFQFGLERRSAAPVEMPRRVANRD